MKRWLVSWVALILAVIIPFGALAATPTVSKENPLSFNTTTLYGKSINSSIIKKYDLVMMNYWAEWCGPCVGELPALQKISETYKNVLVLGVYVDSNVNGAISTAENVGVTYPLFQVTYDLYEYLERSGGGFSIPQTCFFNNKGYLLNQSYVGSRSYDAWESIVKELLAATKKTTVTKPKIKTQPKSLTRVVGQKATFKVKASGKNLKYQWYYRTSAAGKWKKITSKGTSATYTVKVKARHNGYQYRCLVKNSAGKVYSKTVKLKVKDIKLLPNN